MPEFCAAFPFFTPQPPQGGAKTLIISRILLKQQVFSPLWGEYKGGFIKEQDYTKLVLFQDEYPTAASRHPT